MNIFCGFGYLQIAVLLVNC